MSSLNPEDWVRRSEGQCAGSTLLWQVEGNEGGVK